MNKCLHSLNEEPVCLLYLNPISSPLNSVDDRLTLYQAALLNNKGRPHLTMQVPIYIMRSWHYYQTSIGRLVVAGFCLSNHNLTLVFKGSTPMALSLCTHTHTCIVRGCTYVHTPPWEANNTILRIRAFLGSSKFSRLWWTKEIYDSDRLKST